MIYISFVTSFIFIFQYVYAEGAAQDLSLPLANLTKDLNTTATKETVTTKIEDKVNETVYLELYYECHCPYCMDFGTSHLKNVIDTLNPYLIISTYPYGNADTNETNGEVTFSCQHGPEECYGNKLHACALKHITNYTEALLFNICLMDPIGFSIGSDDVTTNKCAREMKVDKEPILECAKGNEGTQLLKYYGEETKKENFRGVPRVLVNGVKWTYDLMKDVCATFKNPPEACKQEDKSKDSD